MTRTSSAAVVRVVRLVPVRPERVYEAWIDPAILARWISPLGRAEAAVEPWVGGRLQVTMIEGDVRIEHTGEYRELVPGRRLVFTWQSPYTGTGPSVVTVELEPVDTGTALTLVHEHLPPDGVDSHRGGWGQILDRLSAVLGAEPRDGGLS